MTDVSNLWQHYIQRTVLVLSTMIALLFPGPAHVEIYILSLLRALPVELTAYQMLIAAL